MQYTVNLAKDSAKCLMNGGADESYIVMVLRGCKSWTRQRVLPLDLNMQNQWEWYAVVDGFGIASSDQVQRQQ